MKIEYELTLGQLYRANLLLTYYRVRTPIVIYFVLYFLYSFFTHSLISYIISVPIILLISVLFCMLICFIMVNRNKHFIGMRVLEVTHDGYQYYGENFRRESKWSEKKKIWITPWYIYLDVKSLYPVIVICDALTDDYIKHLQEIFG